MKRFWLTSAVVGFLLAIATLLVVVYLPAKELREVLGVLFGQTAAAWVQALGSIAGIAAGAAAIRWQVRTQAQQEERKRESEREHQKVLGLLAAAAIAAKVNAVQTRLMEIHPDMEAMKRRDDTRDAATEYFNRLRHTLQNLPYDPSQSELEKLAVLGGGIAQTLARAFAELKQLGDEVAGFAPCGGESVPFTSLFDGAMILHLEKWKQRQSDVIMSLSKISYRLAELAN